MTTLYSFADDNLKAGDCQKFKYFDSLDKCEEYVRDSKRTGKIRYGTDTIRMSVSGTIFKEQL